MKARLRLSRAEALPPPRASSGTKESDQKAIEAFELFCELQKEAEEGWWYSTFIIVTIVSIGLYIAFSAMMLDATERATKAKEELNRIHREHLECYRRGECKQPPRL